MSGGLNGPVDGVAFDAMALGFPESAGAAWQATLNASLIALQDAAGLALPAASPEIGADPAETPAAASGEGVVADATTMLSSTVSPMPGQSAPLTAATAGTDRSEAGARSAGETVTATGPATATPPTQAGQAGTLAQAGPGAPSGFSSPVPDAEAHSTASQASATPLMLAGQTAAVQAPLAGQAGVMAQAGVGAPLSIVPPARHAEAHATGPQASPAPALSAAVTLAPERPAVVAPLASPVLAASAARSADPPVMQPVPAAAAAGPPGMATPATVAMPALPMSFVVDYPGVPPGAGPQRPIPARQRRTAPLVHRAPPREPSLLVQDFRTVSAAIQCVSYGEQRPIPIDIAPHAASVPVWRLDDTEMLVVADESGRGVASVRAAALHRALMDDGADLSALQPGEGFATWEGSPLWLRLAGIDKPAELGVLLDRSVPPRLSVMRTGELSWRVDSDDPAQRSTRETLHPFGTARSAAVRDAILFAGSADGFGPVAVAMAAAAALPAPHRCRVQEALAAVARCARWSAKGAGPELRACLETVAGGRGLVSAPWARLRRLGASVLDTVAAGGVHEIGPLEGLALAMALGRLPMADDPA